MPTLWRGRQPTAPAAFFHGGEIVEAFASVLLWVALLNPPADQHTLKLIKLTGHDSFKVREDATLKLKKKVTGKDGLKIVPQLEWEVRHNPDAEIRQRCKWVVKHFYVIGPSDKNKKMPWICFTDKRTEPYNFQKDDGQCLRHYLETAAKTYNGHQGCETDGWLPWRTATELMCHAMLRVGVPRKRVIEMIDRMVEEEEAYNSKAVVR
jgi:hypothetical protein